jgi:hypothetical protein
MASTIIKALDNVCNMKNNKQYRTVGTVPNFKKKIVGVKINTPKTHMPDRSLYWLGIDTSIKSGGMNKDLNIKQFQGPKPSLLVK